MITEIIVSLIEYIMLKHVNPGTGGKPPCESDYYSSRIRKISSHIDRE